MNEFTHVKIEIFIPRDYVDRLREALASVGVGRIGNYDHCCSITEVRGYWRPLTGAHPFMGELHQVEEGAECKVEANCQRELVKEVIAAIKKVHPYEEPVINIIPLVNNLFE